MSLRGTILRASIASCGFWLAGVGGWARADVPQYRAIELFRFNDLAGATRSVAPGAADAAGGQVVGNLQEPNDQHALLWQDPSGAPLDLQPGGFANSVAFATDGSRQVGEAWNSSIDAGSHAMLWSGTAGSAVDLHPASAGRYVSSAAFGVHGNQQVGYAETGNGEHAMVWTGTAASAVDLHPVIPGIVLSRAYSTDGTHQVGFAGLTGLNLNTHALLWSGTASSVVDLNPTGMPGLNGSQAYGVGGNEQVGYGNFPDGHHALLWTGSAASAIDLTPTNLSGFGDTTAVATNGRQQVGYGGGPIAQALLWNGTPDSAVDLHALLPPGFDESEADYIDAAGDVFGTAEAVGSVAFEWVPVPEPAATLALAASALLFRRRGFRG